MNQEVELAIVAAIPPTIVAITGLLVVIGKLAKIEKQTNGLLSAEKDKVAKAEMLSPGITRVPKGSTVSTTLSVNDPTNDEPPIVTSQVTNLAVPNRDDH